MSKASENYDALPSVELRYDALVLDQIRKVTEMLSVTIIGHLSTRPLRVLEVLLYPYLPPSYFKKHEQLQEEYLEAKKELKAKHDEGTWNIDYDGEKHAILSDYMLEWFSLLMTMAKEKGLLPQEVNPPGKNRAQRAYYG